MFGRVRASPISSLELLEMERPPSKIIKHDSLSIYESTLLKLKQGSHCNPRYNPEDSCTMATDSPGEGITAADADCTSSDSISGDSSVSFQSTLCSSNEKGSKNMSILYLFSKYKSTQHSHNSNETEAMAVESGYSSSSSSSVSTVSGS
ncbi:hypothetical protein ABFS82_09G062200 [Erythranthe guttata]|nr:PREDICTED: uncharacterized protein LOC105974035 [Erythranthe guttata]|eukprot:XP_012854527.1 PREDICTED: uncharacterized protein LOC105974035 [Erythranthe guttata]